MPAASLSRAVKPDKIISVIGFDYGSRRIGVAVGQTLTQTASPLSAIKADRKHVLWQQLNKLVATWQPDAMVVGLPLRMDGSEQAVTHEAQAFIKRLKKNYGLPVFTVDERLSTVEAKSMAGLHGVDPHAFDIDSEAARLILESWLHQPSPGDSHD